MRLLGYIVLWTEPYEGLETHIHDGTQNDPLPVFDSRKEAERWAKRKKLAAKNTEILVIDLTPTPEAEPEGRNDQR